MPRPITTTAWEPYRQWQGNTVALTGSSAQWKVEWFPSIPPEEEHMAITLICVRQVEREPAKWEACAKKVVISTNPLPGLTIVLSRSDQMVIQAVYAVGGHVVVMVDPICYPAGKSKAEIDDWLMAVDMAHANWVRLRMTHVVDIPPQVP